jgi:hypothetical protein
MTVLLLVALGFWPSWPTEPSRSALPTPFLSALRENKTSE